jgi:hypothetical protein
MTGDVQNGEAPTLLRERLEICFDKYLDSLFTGKDLEANRRIAEVNLVASPIPSSNDGIGHYRPRVEESLPEANGPRPLGCLL